MKKVLIGIVFSFLSVSLNGQCIAEAGGTIFSCDSDSSAVVLGGLPSAYGGIPPYQYSWRIEPIVWFPGSPWIFHASDLLDDTTLANPTIIDRYIADSIMFILEVQDSLGCKAQDSCLVVLSNFIHSLDYYSYYINKGDSVYLNYDSNVSGGIGSLSFQWNPTHGLSDSTKLKGFWAKPDSTIKYRITVTDEIGCKATGAPYYFIYVNHISLEEISSFHQIKIFPNPVGNRLSIEGLPSSNEIILEIQDLSGQVVLRQENFASNSVDLMELKAGMYLIKVISKNWSFHQKIIKE